ncbi:hypothetical protein [Streptococcus sciuri]|nr:hypothetical protein [Streptococcus sciuri]
MPKEIKELQFERATLKKNRDNIVKDYLCDKGMKEECEYKKESKNICVM